MANGVYHSGYGIEIDLTRRDLGHPGRPGLWSGIYGDAADDRPGLLQCLTGGRGRCCGPGAEAGPRSSAMYIRVQEIHGVPRPVAVHRNPGHHMASAEERDQREALKERICQEAGRAGFAADTGSRSSGGRLRTDVVVEGDAGISIGWEPQMSPLTPGTVRKRSRRAEADGVTPMWLTKSDKAALIDRAPWSRIRDTPWRAISGGEPLQIVGGVKSLRTWRCDSYAATPCPEPGHGRCGNWHGSWVSARNLLLSDLVRLTASGDYASLQVPAKHGRGHFLWADVREVARFRELRPGAVPVERAEPPPTAPRSISALHGSVLDWSPPEHWNPETAPCSYCGQDCSLFDERGMPMHKVCAEGELNRMRV